MKIEVAYVWYGDGTMMLTVDRKSTVMIKFHVTIHYDSDLGINDPLHPKDYKLSVKLSGISGDDFDWDRVSEIVEFVKNHIQENKEKVYAELNHPY